MVFIIFSRIQSRNSGFRSRRKEILQFFKVCSKRMTVRGLAYNPHFYLFETELCTRVSLAHGWTNNMYIYIYIYIYPSI